MLSFEIFYGFQPFLIHCIIVTQQRADFDYGKHAYRLNLRLMDSFSSKNTDLISFQPEMKIDIKNITGTHKIDNGLFHLMRIGNSIQHSWVNMLFIFRGCLFLT